MGCYNGTCGVSQLPIRAGDKVRTFILVPHWFRMGGYYSGKPLHEVVPFSGTGTCYSTDMYSPLTFPIKGEYNDYGSTENIKTDDNVKAIIKWFNDEIKAKHITVTKESDLPQSGILSSIEEVFTFIDRGDTPFGVMMVLENIYLAGVAAQEESLDSKYSSDQLRVNIDEDVKLAQEFIQKKTAKVGLSKLGSKLSLKETEALDDDLTMRKLLGPKFPVRKGSNTHYGNIVSRLTSGRGESAMMDSDFASDYFDDILKKKNAPLKDIADYIQFFNFMSKARRMFIPQSGQGSQDEDFRLHRMIAKAVAVHIKTARDAHYEDIGGVEADPEELAHMKKLF